MLVLWSSLPVEAHSFGNKWAHSDVMFEVLPYTQNMDFPDFVPDNVILAMGEEVLSYLSALGHIPKNRTVNSLRGQDFVLPSGAKLLCTYSPIIGGIDYESHVNCVLDLRAAVRMNETGTLKPTIGDYRYVDSLSAAIMEARDGQKTIRAVALDLETLGTDPYDDEAYVISIQLSFHAGSSVVKAFRSKDEWLAFCHDTKERFWLKSLLESSAWVTVGANLKYDLNWLKVHCGLECTNFHFDTFLVGSLLDENRANSLNLHTKWYAPELGGYDDHFDKTYNKSRMDLALASNPDDFLTYAGGDTDACLRVYHKMREELVRDKKLTRFYINILQPAARAYEHVEQTGLLVDVPYFMELEDRLLDQVENMEKRLRQMISGKVLAKHFNKKARKIEIKASLVAEHLFTKAGLNLTPKMKTEKTKLPSTAENHLKQFAEHPKARDFVSLYMDLVELKKTISTYIVARDDEGNVKKGFLKHLRSDSRFHPTYFLANTGDRKGGTNTGRLSARDPAIQTVPKRTAQAKMLRRGLIAPDDCEFLSLDYSQGELKIAACLAQEATMIEAYRNGIDLHAITAARLAGWDFKQFMELGEVDPEKFDRIRYLGKAGNFGLIYGMGAEGFMRYAKLSYGVTLTIEEATKARQDFFELYSGLTNWHAESKAMAKKFGYVYSPLGRIRHLPMVRSFDEAIAGKALRQAINAPVQATLSDLSLWATAILHEKGVTKKAPVVAMVHDQLIAYCPKDEVEYYAGVFKHVMENLPLHKVGWSPQLKFTVDCEVGPNLGEMKKLKSVAPVEI